MDNNISNFLKNGGDFLDGKEDIKGQQKRKALGKVVMPRHTTVKD